MINKSLKEFNEILFSKEPVPGGGGASAVVAALSASLGGMVINLTSGKKKFAEYENELADLKNKLDCLKDELLDGVNKDAEAFAPLALAYAIPKDDPLREIKLEECLKTAADAPFSLLIKVSETITVLNRLKDISSKLAISDVATAACFADAALYGLSINVKVNTRLMKDVEFAKDMERQTDKLVKKYSEISKEIYRIIEEKL